MNPRTLNALLGGMLVASAALNLRGLWNHDSSSVPEPTPAASPVICEGSCCYDLSMLDLQPEQRAQLESHGERCCEAHQECVDHSEALRAQLAEALAEPRPDVDRVRELVEELNESRAAALRACIDSMLVVRDLLSEEQCRMLGCCSGLGDAAPETEAERE